MKTFDSTSCTKMPYRMKFSGEELRVSMGYEEKNYIDWPVLDERKEFLKDAITDFLKFNPTQLRVIETVMLNTLKGLTNEGEKWKKLRRLLEYMESTRKEILEERLSGFPSLQDAGFEATSRSINAMSYMSPNVNITSFSAYSKSVNTKYSISVKEYGTILVAEDSKVFSTSPDFERGQSLLNEETFRRAVSLCIRMDPQKFYEIASKLKEFVDFSKKGAINAVSIHYFYLNFMASEEAFYRKIGGWNTCQWLE